MKVATRAQVPPGDCAAPAGPAISTVRHRGQPDGVPAGPQGVDVLGAPELPGLSQQRRDRYPLPGGPLLHRIELIEQLRDLC